MSKTRQISLVLAVFICVFLLASCSQEKQIIGKWKASSSLLGIVELNTVYEFRDYMTGIKSTVLGIKTNFVYEFDENGILRIVNNILGQEIEEAYMVNISDAELIFTDKEGGTVTLERHDEE